MLTQFPHPDDAFTYLVEGLRTGLRRSHQPWWDVNLSAIVRDYVAQSQGPAAAGREPPEDVSRAFRDAAWRLCRMGVLRPTINYTQRIGASQPPFPGDDYSVTLAGREWLKSTELTYVPSDPGRYVALLAKEIEKLGPGFAQRALEAAGCHQTGNYLASCAMSGAAAESAVLSTAIAKTGDEAKVLGEYQRPNGRRVVMDLIFGTKPTELEKRFIASTFNLLAYWRDDAAHGRASPISELDAYHALTLLLRLAQFLCTIGQV